jgi:hypothetical protein
MKTIPVFAVTILACLVLGTRPESAAAPPDDVALKGLGWADEYRVDPYIAAAAELRAAGKEKAAGVLRAAAKDPEVGSLQVIILCRLLFTAKAKGEFRRAMIGAPHNLDGTASWLGGGSDRKDWPLEPIEVVDGVPLLVVAGYTLGGQPESPEQYLDYCLKECAWGATEFKPRTAAEKEKALAALLASKKWKKPLTVDERQFLAAQIK